MFGPRPEKIAQDKRAIMREVARTYRRIDRAHFSGAGLFAARSYARYLTRKLGHAIWEERPMLASVRVCLVALVVALALPGIGGAQGVTTFDGTYNGVSNTMSGGRMCTPPVPVPRPLTIRNGAVSWAGGLTGNTQFQGTVNAQANISARSVSGQTGIVFSGTVANGRITGGGSVAGTSCSLMSVWQKQ